MLTIFIKTYCDNVVVNMRPIYLKKHLFLLVSSQLESKTIESKLFIESETQKSIFQGRTILKSMLKSSKYIW